MNNEERVIKLEEARLIGKIVNRGWGVMKKNYKERLDMILDIEVANRDCPLKLQELLDADDANFYHDIIGIGQHLNRQTRKLGNCFIPRFAKRMGKTEQEAESVKRFEEEARTLDDIEEKLKGSQRDMLGEMISDAEKLDKAEENKWSYMKEKHFYRIETMLDAYQIIFGYHEHRDITNTDDLDYAGLDVEAAKKRMEDLK